MFALILTLTEDFLATTRCLALELPQLHIDTNKVQQLDLLPEVTLEEAQHFANNYIASGWYEKVEIIQR